MNQHKNNQVMNSLSNGNGNWMARDEEEYEPEIEVCVVCKDDPEIKECGTCCRGVDMSQLR